MAKYPVTRGTKLAISPHMITKLDRGDRSEDMVNDQISIIINRVLPLSRVLSNPKIT